MKTMKINISLPQWMADSLSLALIFAWLLSYPLHGPVSYLVFGQEAYLTGKVFALSHGFGLIVLALGPYSLVKKKAVVICAGAVLFLVSGLWTHLSAATPFHYWTAALLGFVSSLLVLAWLPLFLKPQNPVLKVGLAMVLAQFLLGLSGVVLAPDLPSPLVKATAMIVSLGPLAGALLIAGSKSDLPPFQRQAEGKPRQKIRSRLVLAIIVFAAATYFIGGLWYTIIVPLFHLNWPELIGVGSFISAAAVLLYIAIARHYTYGWLGTISLSLLGTGITVSMMVQDRVGVLLSILFLSLGFAAMDLFYWLALRTLAGFYRFPGVFGLGFGISLFFLTIPGLILEDGHVSGQFPIGHLAAASGICLLFVAAPLLILFSPYLTSSEQESMLISKQLKNAKEMATKNEAAASEQLPSFWPNLTNQEKKVYEQLILGHTDAEIAKRLYVTRHTIKFHTRNILRKAAVTNRRKLPVVTLHKNNEDIETGV